jgi:hypothetical protein
MRTTTCSRSHDSYYLSEREVPFGELENHFLCTKGIIQLDFEILNLRIRIRELDQGRIELRSVGVSWRVVRYVDNDIMFLPDRSSTLITSFSISVIRLRCSCSVSWLKSRRLTRKVRLCVGDRRWDLVPD